MASQREWAWQRSRVESRGNCYRCRNRHKTAGVIRFNLMCAHTVNGPDSRSSTSRYVMAFHDASLPIQRNGRGATPRTGKSNVKKCFGSEVGTRDVYGVRTTGNNTGAVGLKLGHSLSGYRHSGNIEFSAIRIQIHNSKGRSVAASD